LRHLPCRRAPGPAPSPHRNLLLLRSTATRR